MYDFVPRDFVLQFISLDPSARLQMCDYGYLLGQMTEDERTLALQWMTGAEYHSFIAAIVEHDDAPLHRDCLEVAGLAMQSAFQDSEHREVLLDAIARLNRGSDFNVGGQLVAWLFMTSINDALKEADRARGEEEAVKEEGQEGEEQEGAKYEDEECEDDEEGYEDEGENEEYEEGYEAYEDGYEEEYEENLEVKEEM